MKIILFNMGRTQETYLKEGITLYEKRIRHYVPYETLYLTAPRSAGNQPEIQRENEGKVLLVALEQVDLPVLLDERGKNMSSSDFAKYLQLAMNKGKKSLGFVIGGPFGFSNQVYQSVPEMISLSAMTFPHQLIRLIFLEQLYRAFTIIRGESYHHA
jgi:23S rRNA (pseudouridine1915-N3)-methyltransferase